MPSPGIQDPLRERGVRLTRHRRNLLDLLAEERDPKLNRVTVYRSLKLFKDGALVDEHAHVICLHCGKIEEYFCEPPKEIRRQVEEHFGFEVALTRTEIGGYCPRCRALRAQEASKPANA
jgi:Fur family transcriptional regulator, ferric uptake regulator